MNKRNIISLFGLVFLLSGLAPAAQASSRVDVDTNEKNYAPSVSSWEEYGEADVLSDGRVRITRDDDGDGYAFTDVDVPSKNQGDYALFVSFTRAEDPHSDLSSGAENIAGLPYLYAYFLDEDGDVLEYLQGDTMRHKASYGTAWNVRYRYARLDDDTESMRVFLKQASRKGTDADGRAAWFYKPALYFVDSGGDAVDIVEAYQDELDDVADLFNNRATRTSDDDEDEEDDSSPDYAVGTLLKCSGDSDVYSMTSSNTLKRYPNEDTFYAWGKSFADVRTISCSRLDDYRVSGTWTYERADYLVKFRGMAAVFTLDNDKYLRLIPDEYTAKQMFGSRWTSKINEYSTSKMGDYYYSAPHESLR